MIEEPEFHYTIYTAMPRLALGLPRKEPNLFATLTPHPHDDETDEEIDMDMDWYEDGDGDGDPEDETSERDLLFKLKSYLNHLHQQAPSSSPDKVTLDTLALSVSPHPSDLASLALPTSRSTKRRRPRNLRQNALTKPSRKALPR